MNTDRWLELVRKNTRMAIKAFNDGAIPPGAFPAIAIPWEDGTKSVTFIHMPDDTLRKLADGGEPAMTSWLEKAREGDFEGFTMLRP